MFYQFIIKQLQVYQRVFEVLETKPKVEDQGVYETLTPIENMIEF